LEREKKHQIEEIKRRSALYVGVDVDVDNTRIFDNKTVILVDDGAAIGATIIVAARSIKRRFKLKRLIITLPVAPKEIMKQEADLVEVVTSPSNFHAVAILSEV